MGIFDSIKSALGFGDDTEQADVSASAFGDAAANAAEEVAEVAPDASENFAESAESAVETVDVAGKMDALAANNSEDLDWKSSIVDLMKLLDMDSSYGNRKELAGEVGIEGYEGNADQNIALHKAVLTKLAANGGNIPADLLS